MPRPHTGRLLHAAARFVLDLRPRDYVTAVLQSIHWLPVRQRITYKLCVLMHGVVFGYAPTDISAGRRCATLDSPGRAHLRRATGVIFDRFKSVFRRRYTSLESTPCISSSHELCRNFQTSSQNRTIQGGVRCSWQLTATNLILTLTIVCTIFTILLFY